MASLYIYGWDGVDCMRSLPLTHSNESMNIATIATDSAVLIIKETDNNTRKIHYYTRDNSFHIPCLLNVLKDCLAIVQEGDDVVVGSGDSIAACATTREITIIDSYLKDPQSLAGVSSFTPRIFHNPLQAPVRKLACGSSHCLILGAYRCFAYGSNEYGQLGIGTQSVFETELREVVLPDSREGVQDIATGSNHSAIVSAQYGHVYTFGNGAYFKLGHGTDDHCLVPTRVVELEEVGEFRMDGHTAGIALVACGAWHTVVVTKGTNDVYGWGWNNFGNIGRNPSAKHRQACTDGSRKSESLPPHVSEIIALPRRIDELDDAYLLGDGDTSLLGEGYGTVCALSCGSRHTALRTVDGRVIILGQLGPARIPALDPPATLLPERILGIRQYPTQPQQQQLQSGDKRVLAGSEQSSGDKRVLAGSEQSCGNKRVLAGSEQSCGNKRTLAGSEQSSSLAESTTNNTESSKNYILYDWHLSDTHARVLSMPKLRVATQSTTTPTVLDIVSAGRCLYCIVE